MLISLCVQSRSSALRVNGAALSPMVLVPGGNTCIAVQSRRGFGDSDYSLVCRPSATHGRLAAAVAQSRPDCSWNIVLESSDPVWLDYCLHGIVH